MKSIRREAGSPCFPIDSTLEINVRLEDNREDY